MLTLTRRVGETICLGDDASVTVYDRLRYHVLIGVIAAADSELRLGEVPMRPAVLPDGKHFYLLTMQSNDAFALGDIRVVVRFRPTYLAAANPAGRQLKVSVWAPSDVRVLREELYLERLAASGTPRPPLPFSRWLRSANQRVSGRMAA